MSKRKKTVPAVNPANETAGNQAWAKVWTSGGTAAEAAEARRLANEKEREKAESYLLFYLSEVQRGNRNATDLADWLMQSLTPEALKGLAQDWDSSQADRAADERGEG